MKKDLPCIALITGGHGLSHFAQLALPPLFPLIRSELDISYLMLGFVIMLPSIASAVLQPLAGFLVDRIGGRDVLIGGVAVLALGVLLCFLFFLLWGASTAGLANFSISAMQMQFEVDVLLASAAVTAYMIGNAAGQLAGGFVAVRVVRHDIVAASGLAFAALIVLL